MITPSLIKDAPAHPQPPANYRLLGRRIDKVTRAEAVAWARRSLAAAVPRQLVTANPLMLLTAGEDPELARIIDQAGLVVPESSGIAWASKHIGTPLPEFIPGIDLFLELCRLARDSGRGIFLLGAQPGVAEKAGAALIDKFPGLRIAGTQHGYFSAAEEAGILARIGETTPGFLFVGMSVPKQEKWIHRHLSSLGVPIVMGVGGSFDVLSGNLRRAPSWMQELGLEWIFRTLQEPWRIKRIIHLPVFVWKVLTK